MIPGQIAAQPPANKPYRMQNTYKAGKVAEKPQTSKTDTAAPTAEISIQVVGRSRSLSKPIITRPMVTATFISITVKVERKLEVPKCMRAYIGKKIPGRK